MLPRVGINGSLLIVLRRRRALQPMPRIHAWQTIKVVYHRGWQLTFLITNRVSPVTGATLAKGCLYILMSNHSYCTALGDEKLKD